MTVGVFVRRFLTEYARNKVNLLLLVVVPVVFGGVVADAMADAARLLGGPGGPSVQTAAAGWAAAFPAGIGMYFQTATTRETDQRRVIAGLPAARLVVARLLTGLGLAVLASMAALVTLAVRDGIDEPGRVAAGTVMSALIYVAVGAVTGALVPTPVNGNVLVLFVWIVDVFFGPALGAADRPATRWLPTHYVSLWMIRLPSGHAGVLGDLGIAMLWTGCGVVVAWAVAVARTRGVRRPGSRARPGGVAAQVLAAVRSSWRDTRRNVALWALFVAVPVVFILSADAVTPDRPISLTVREHGRQLTRTFAMPDVHGATMASIAVASLAALVGLFVVLDNRAGDRRAALAGLRPGVLLTARLAVLTGTLLLAVAVSLATTALVFQATRWPVYATGNVLVALTYGLIGALLAPVFGRVGGVFVAFLLPFLDIGITQSPMLHPTPVSWSKLLPGYGGSRVLLDGALTRGFDEYVGLASASGWLVALVVIVSVLYRRATVPRVTSGQGPSRAWRGG
ncbi:MAG TPA: ABC transporter permease [Micromonospora sp.]